MERARQGNGLSRGWGVVVAGVAATFVWGWTMGSAPRYSFGPDQDDGHLGLLLLGLAMVALIAGATTPRHAVLVGVTTVVVPILLAPGTAPRGDGDGLWVLVFFVLTWCLPLRSGSRAWPGTRESDSPSDGGDDMLVRMLRRPSVA
jgi:peptidoglycan/LPS O-acetylase OafA/YrhL